MSLCHGNSVSSLFANGNFSSSMMRDLISGLAEHINLFHHCSYTPHPHVIPLRSDAWEVFMETRHSQYVENLSKWKILSSYLIDEIPSYIPLSHIDFLNELGDFSLGSSHKPSVVQSDLHSVNFIRKRMTIDRFKLEGVFDF